jgi:methylmalonyl-CoA epimerase
MSSVNSHILSHVGIATNDIDKSVAIYRQLCPELIVHDRITVAEQGVIVCFLDFPVHCSQGRIELLQPLDDSSPLAKFISKRGEGLHHICFACENLAEELKRLSAAGFQLIDERPRQGASGRPIAFVHPKSTGGTLIEFEEE